MRPRTVTRVAMARLGIAPVPLALGFEITHQCNLACDYCDRHTPMPNEMTTPQIIKALGELHELGMEHISLDGGEALVHRHIGEVVDFLVGLRVRVYLNSNGKLIPRRLDIVRKTKKVKISLDGPREVHDSIRGSGSFDKAIAGARAARGEGVAVAMTCVVGTHNVDHLDELLDFIEAEEMPTIFQPARPSLFIDGPNRDAPWVLEADRMREALASIAKRKRSNRFIANGWASLRHFRSFPANQKLPCAAGWINATLDPEGNLYPCGQISRMDKRHNVVRLGAKKAFEGLRRTGCQQCWCARVVEENYAWGARLDKMLPTIGAGE